MSNKRMAFEEESLSRSPQIDVLLLFLFTTLLSLWGLSSGPMLSDHEAIVAQGARQILQGDGWLIPKVGDAPFIRKPPLPFWLTALASKVVDPAGLNQPVTPRAARLPSALAAILTTMLVYALGKSMFGHRSGVLCGLAATTCLGSLFFSHEAQVEMLLTLLCTACFASFWWATQGAAHRKWWLVAFYVCFALSLMAKAPFPLAVVGLPLACWWLVTVPLFRCNETRTDEGTPELLRTLVWRQVVGLKTLWSTWGVVLFLIIFGPWPIYVFLRIENAMELWRMEFLSRYTGELYGEEHRFHYYLPIALGWMVPFSLSLPEAISSPFISAYRPHRKPLLYAFTWVVITTVFLSTSAFKVPRYLVVCIPGFALLLGPVLDRLFLAARSFSTRGLRLAKGALVMLLPVAGVVGGFVFARKYPGELSVYRVAGLLALFGAAASCMAFAPGRRLMSLLLLEGSVALSFAFAWDALSASGATQQRTVQLVQQLNAHFIDSDDRVTWVGGRADARLVYYTGLRIRPLFDDRELGAIREGRRALPPELLNESIHRITERLVSNAEEYFIIDARLYDRVHESLSIPAREVFRVAGTTRRDDDLVVITNDWNTGEWEKIYPAKDERQAKQPTVLKPIGPSAPGE